MCSEADENEVWGFWRIVYVPIIIHAVLMLTGVIANIFERYTHPSDIQWNSMSLQDATAVYLCQAPTGPPFMWVGSILVIWGVVLARRHTRFNRVLFVYVTWQLLVGLVIASAFVYLIPQGYVVLNQRPSGSPEFSRAWSLNDLLQWTIGYCWFSTPLLLFASRGIWVLIVRPIPAVDKNGRFLNCTKCRYDLRGSPGSTCPECGVAVMAQGKSKKTTSTAAD